MKIKYPFNLSRLSFAGRLTFWIMATTLVVMALVTYLLTGITKAAMEGQAESRYQGVMEFMNESVSRELTAVEVAVANTVPEIEASLDEPEKMYDIVRRILRLNPNIVGSAIAFEPYNYPEKGIYFSPYAYRADSLTVEVRQLGNEDYEYHFMDWYQIPKLLGKPYWSDPYYDTGGGEITMSTYSLPLYDSNGMMYAIVTADISLEWLTDQLEAIDRHNNDGGASIKEDKYASYSFIIGRNASYIVHPFRERLLKDTYFVFAEETEDEGDNEIGYEMIEGKRGMRSFLNDDVRSVIFYAPITRTGWSMGIVVSSFNMYLLANVLGGIVLALMLMGMVVLFFICQKAIRHVVNPLTQFAKSADEIAKGNFEAPLPEIKIQGEMMQLRDSFEIMQTSLVNRIEELKVVNEKKGRMDSELQIARDIQMSMLPKMFPPYPERNDLDIYGRLTPAKEVGGDLFDFFIRDEKLFFCIGDVSGKGVPASLVMAVTRAQFRTVAGHEDHPSKIVANINELMTNGNDSNMFVTLFVGVMNLKTGVMQYCNAGHDAPLIIGQKDVSLLEVDTNLPVGLMQGWDFSEQEMLLKRGSMIYLYTDGLTEAEDINHGQFGEERIFEVVHQALGQKEVTSTSLIDSMTAAVHAFVGEAEQSDDLTMLGVRFL